MSTTDGEPPKPERPEPLARAALQRRKRRDAALALPVAGAFLLASPFLDVFAGPARVLGVPLGAAYVFVVWFALIAAAARLSRRLADDDGSG